MKSQAPQPRQPTHHDPSASKPWVLTGSRSVPGLVLAKAMSSLSFLDPGRATAATVAPILRQRKSKGSGGPS